MFFLKRKKNLNQLKRLLKNIHSRFGGSCFKFIQKQIPSKKNYIKLR